MPGAMNVASADMGMKDIYEDDDNPTLLCTRERTEKGCGIDKV
jgi:hypothetical protein